MWAGIERGAITLTMATSVILYTILVLAAAAGRLLEVRHSKRNQQRLLEKGSAPLPEPKFRIMVILHVAVMIMSVVEVWALQRPFIPLLGVPMLIIFILCNLLRYWVIATLADHWNIQVVNSLGMGVVTTGPFRYIRHPNYVAIFFELLSLPLIHSALITAIIGTIVNIYILYSRIQLEETVLLNNDEYQRAMASKPRFIPRFR